MKDWAVHHPQLTRTMGMSFRPLATMNFVDLDLTMSDRWHGQQQQQISMLNGLLRYNDYEGRRVTHRTEIF
ncbi:hypothetical protein TNCV_983131 [Trichonephila clavipes]|nr:hypothetical protein TNCV_983131 [Trichonephila clavipes]